MHVAESCPIMKNASASAQPGPAPARHAAAARGSHAAKCAAFRASSKRICARACVGAARGCVGRAVVAVVGVRECLW
jgi:hypothetical protein